MSLNQEMEDDLDIAVKRSAELRSVPVVMRNNEQHSLAVMGLAFSQLQRIAREECLPLIRDSLAYLRMSDDGESERPMKEVCFCTETGTGSCDLVCLPCRLHKFLAHFGSE